MSFRVSFMTSADIIEFMKNMALKSYSKLLKVMALLLVVMVVSYHSGLAGSALAHASDLHEDEVEFAADEVSINREEGILIATGNVVLKQMGQILNADKIIYNQTTDIALANGNVVLTMPDGTLIRSDQMELDENFTHLVASPVIAQYEDGSRFSAETGERTEDIRAVFDRGRFSPCKCDYDKGESPIWDLRSTQITHDMTTKTISYKNVRMHIFGVPVFYTPYLAHADSSVNRRSGFLAPSFGYSRDMGAIFTLPYFQVLGPTHDVEFKPTIFSKRGQAMRTEYRKRWDKASLNASLITGRLETYKKNREQVAAVDARFVSRLGEDWHIDARLRRASQDTFMRRYGYESDTKLKSEIVATKLDTNRYYRVEASDVQGLGAADKQSNEPVILPSVYYENYQPTGRKGQHIRTEISALQLDNDDGHEMVRWVAEVEGRQQMEMVGGIVDVNVGGQASYYDVQKRADGGDFIGEIGRAHGFGSLSWRSPLSVDFPERRFVIEPQAKYTHIFGANRNDEIPNRDAGDFRLDEANLFLENRYQGKDYVLPGGRADLGIAALTSDDIIGDVSGFIGVSRHLSGERDQNLTTQGDNDYSDYVASLSFDPPGPVSISWSGRMDSEDFELNESSTRLDVAYGGTSLALRHTQISKAHFTSATSDLEEATATLTQALGAGWSAKAEQIWDLSNGKTKRDKSTVSLAWAGGFQDCLTLSLDYKRDPTKDRDIKTIDEVQIVLNFKYLGSISQSDLKNR